LLTKLDGNEKPKAFFGRGFEMNSQTALAISHRLSFSKKVNFYLLINDILSQIIVCKGCNFAP